MTSLSRFVTFLHQNKTKFGALSGSGIVDLSEQKWGTLQRAIEEGALSKLAELVALRSPDIDAEAVIFLPPLLSPRKIICVGVNYPERNEEYRDGHEAPRYPSLFVRFPSSFVGHNQPLVRPKASVQLDYEGEIAVVIGRSGRHIAKAQAFNHIAGLTLCNDGSVRDWIRHGKFNVTQGKNFESSGSMGPWLVPFRDESQVADIRLSTQVNGEMRQDDRTSRMIFKLPYLIAYISTFTTLQAGDIIVTGTPSGSGARRDPPLFLKPGDVVEVEAEGIGILRNGVIDES